MPSRWQWHHHAGVAARGGLLWSRYLVHGKDKVVEVQALIGDSVDNVPGAPGIGPKTAAQLIQEYGDLDTLLARAGEIKQEKRRQTLIDNAEQARLSNRWRDWGYQFAANGNPTTGLPVFMISDYRNVGYANTMMRPPIEMYGQNIIENLDGADINWQHSFGDTNVTAQAVVGIARGKSFVAADHSEPRFQAPAGGFALSAEHVLGELLEHQ